MMDVREVELMREFIAARGIRRLVHFSPQRNLIGMVRLGGLWARSKLVEFARKHDDEDMLAYVTWNDTLRIDGRLDCINLSVSRINSFLFPVFQRKFEKRFHDEEPWCVIEIDPSVMLRDGVVFTKVNAASGSMRATGGLQGIEGLRSLFCERIVTSRRFGASVDDRTRDKTPMCCPTSVQAEVMVPGDIGFDSVLGIVFRTSDDCARVKSMLQIIAPGVPLPAMRISEREFMGI